MASSNWKKVELAMCRELGGERTGPTGRDLPDCEGVPGLGLEIKAYKKFVFLTKDWEQAVDNAAKLGVTPALLVREGGRAGRRHVQLRCYDLGVMEGMSGLVARTLHNALIGADTVCRIEWADFVRLYRAAYIDKKE